MHTEKQLRTSEPRTFRTAGKNNAVYMRDNRASFAWQANLIGSIQKKKTDTGCTPRNDTAQLMRPARSPTEQQGGTCGLYSLFMASQPPLSLTTILTKAHDEGTNVGEFFDAEKLKKVAEECGCNPEVQTFADSNEMKTKLNGTGTKGVIMGYSAYNLLNYEAIKNTIRSKTVPLPGQTQADADAYADQHYKHLAGHWSVIESITDDHVALRDPNSPATQQGLPLTTLYGANRDAADSPNFSFQTFEEKTGSSVAVLKTTYNTLRATHSLPSTGTLPTPLPTVPVDLSGKMIVID